MLTERNGSLAGPQTFEFQTELIPGQVEPGVLCLNHSFDFYLLHILP